MEKKLIVTISIFDNMRERERGFDIRRRAKYRKEGLSNQKLSKKTEHRCRNHKASHPTSLSHHDTEFVSFLFSSTEKQARLTRNVNQ